LEDLEDASAVEEEDASLAAVDAELELDLEGLVLEDLEDACLVDLVVLASDAAEEESELEVEEPDVSAAVALHMLV